MQRPQNEVLTVMKYFGGPTALLVLLKLVGDLETQNSRRILQNSIEIGGDDAVEITDMIVKLNSYRGSEEGNAFIKLVLKQAIFRWANTKGLSEAK